MIVGLTIKYGCKDFLCGDLVVEWLVFLTVTQNKSNIPMRLGSFGLMEHRQAFRFHTPSSLLVVGPSGCGKTVFTTKLLLKNLDLFRTKNTLLLRGMARRVSSYERTRDQVSRRCS